MSSKDCPSNGLTGKNKMKILITGGCGFIGCNTANRFNQLGHYVTIVDDLSRVGSHQNRDWLRQNGQFDFVEADVSDPSATTALFKSKTFDAVIHLAGQVAVTTSVAEPRRDLETNLLGTFNVLEGLRQYGRDTILLNSSTNKVYGKFKANKLSEQQTRYSLPDFPDGIDEKQPLDFHSPYGCSKGAADQYVIDYARIYDLRTVNFRQSCIYGHRQFGMEDQGWLAWFTIAHLLEEPVTIYGNGKQVRDILFVEDLIDAYLAAIERIDQVTGLTFNMGGGPDNTLSLLELLELLRERSGRAVKHSFDEWRPGDQPIYVSNIRRARELLNWEPKISVQEGFKSLFDWVSANRGMFMSRSAAS